MADRLPVDADIHIRLARDPLNRDIPGSRNRPDKLLEAGGIGGQQGEVVGEELDRHLGLGPGDHFVDALLDGLAKVEGDGRKVPVEAGGHPGHQIPLRETMRPELAVFQRHKNLHVACHIGIRSGLGAADPGLGERHLGETTEDPVHHPGRLGRLREGGRGPEVGNDQNRSFVQHRNELRPRPEKKNPRQDHGQNAQDEDGSPSPKSPLEKGKIEGLQALCHALPVVRLSLPLRSQGDHGRHEGEGHHQGEKKGRDDRKSHGGKHLPRHPRKEKDREKDHHDDQDRKEDRTHDLGARPNQALLRRETWPEGFASLDVLRHDDGGIHHHPDPDDDPPQTHEVRRQMDPPHGEEGEKDRERKAKGHRE